MILYHGGQAARPKVASQRELGIQASPYTEEARLHFKTIMTKCDADVSNAIDCRDMNDWASLEAFIEILECAGVVDGRQIATDIWRRNHCQTNTREASAVMRDCLFDYGIYCIHYVDANDLEGLDCYIILEDQAFTVVTSLEEGWPNLAAANDLLSSENKILILSDSRPYFRDSDQYIKVPTELFLADPESVASYIQDFSFSHSEETGSCESAIDKIAEMLESDFRYEAKVFERSLRLLVNSDSLLDFSNPGVSVQERKNILEDSPKNMIFIPCNSNIENVYLKRIRPFVERSL